MKDSSPHNGDWLKSAIGNNDIIKTLHESEQKQQEFLAVLAKNKSDSRQILELLSQVQDELMRSLLIIHLLSQQEYLESLKGESVLTRLTHCEEHQPSRINGLVNQLNIKLLTEKIISQLPQETAVSILCCVAHFHQLSLELVDALLKRYPYPDIISYWMNHYASMPNAHYLLAHLMRLADTHIEIQLGKMEEPGKGRLINNILKHLELFHPAPKILLNYNQEACLILAIRLFLNGHQQPAYLIYINKLTAILLNQKHSFSPEGIQLLISLRDKKEFAELNNKTADLIHQYLRINAQAGSIELFYTSGQLAIHSMTQLLQFTSIAPDKERAQGFFARFLNSEPQQTPELEKMSSPEHPLIPLLIEQRKHISTFDYFLIHYKGNYDTLGKIIGDYLDFFTLEGLAGTRRRLLHQLADLMIRPELERPVREALFAAFLRHPPLCDPHISLNLFLFDAPGAVRYAGRQGGGKSYTQIIDLCNNALQKMDVKQHHSLVHIATKARAEAQLELSFMGETGVIARLFIHLKRCWYYGWTGFFIPNLPKYVVIYNEQKVFEQAIPLITYKSEYTLLHMLKTLPLSASREKMGEIIDALAVLSLKTKVRQELEIRGKVQDYFLSIIQPDNPNKALEHSMLSNLLHLTELTLKKDSRIATQALIAQIKKMPQPLVNFIEELNYTLPEQRVEKHIEKQTSWITESNRLGTTIEAALETTIETSSELAWSAYAWAKGGLGAFFVPQSPLPVMERPKDATMYLFN